MRLGTLALALALSCGITGVLQAAQKPATIHRKAQKPKKFKRKAVKIKPYKVKKAKRAHR